MIPQGESVSAGGLGPNGEHHLHPILVTDCRQLWWKGFKCKSAGMPFLLLPLHAILTCDWARQQPYSDCEILKKKIWWARDDRARGLRGIQREQKHTWILDSLLELLHWPRSAMFECFVMRHKWNPICLSYHALVRLCVICTGNTSLTKPMLCLGWERATVKIMHLYSWETENQMCLNIFDKTVGWVFQKHSFLCSEKPLGGNSSCRKQLLDVVRAWLQ